MTRSIISYLVSLTMRSILTVFSLLACMQSYGQLDGSFRQYYSEQPFKKDADGIYYHYDAQRIIFLSSKDSTYQVYSKQYELQEQGFYTMTAGDSIGRHGLCTDLYSYGKVKAVGNYYKNKPVGEWNRYYPSGRLMANYTIKLVKKTCLTIPALTMNFTRMEVQRSRAIMH
jgi:antitoxin component YwqK of YwqJK toxin-antitoxin module